MIFDFDETCIVREVMNPEDTAETFLKRLDEFRKNTPSKDLQYSIRSVGEKISSLSEKDFEKIKSDIQEHKFVTYPPYTI